MSEKKILVIEDELFLRELYVQVLERAGYTVLSAVDGVEGLQLARDNPDAKLVLLDIMLPKMHGVEVLKQLKADPATQNLPVVILSNLTQEKVIEETMQLGAKGYLVKVQVSSEKLLEKINMYISSPE